MSNVLASGFTTKPFWTTELSRFSQSTAELPECVDVIIIGGGYAGLSGARTLANAGRSVIVFDAGLIGDGASSRSAGSLGNVPKAKFGNVVALYGKEVALALYREARLAREFVEDLIGSEGISCDLQTRGRFVAAHSPTALEKIRSSLDAYRETWGKVHLVEADEQQLEIGSTAFYGGLVLHSSATLQPAALHRGLADAAIAAGALIAENHRVNTWQKTAGRFNVSATGRTFQAANILIATNAETGRETQSTRRLRKGLTLVPAFALVTEELHSDTLRAALPNLRSFSDSYRVLNYMAPVGEKRLIISGRAGRNEGTLSIKAERLFGYFSSRFPSLENVRVTHCWKGHFALTRDWLPHLGMEDGAHYVLGCCGVGVPMSTYLGHKAALKILGDEAGATAYDRPLPRIPYWPANNIFLPWVVRAFALQDRYFY